MNKCKTTSFKHICPVKLQYQQMNNKILHLHKALIQVCFQFFLSLLHIYIQHHTVYVQKPKFHTSNLNFVLNGALHITCGMDLINFTH